MTLPNQWTVDGRGRASATEGRELRARARAVIPGGMYGHLNMNALPPEYPKFFASGRGARVVDVDGREFVDLMCSWGPVLLGHQHPEVEEAVARQAALGDCLDGPSKHGRTLRATGRHSRAPRRLGDVPEKRHRRHDTVLHDRTRGDGQAKDPRGKGRVSRCRTWCTPVETGTTAEDRANLVHYTYNDLESVREAFSDDVAAVSGFAVSTRRRLRPRVGRSGVRARLRELCEHLGAALILDDVRCGMRLHFGGSWEPIGVAPTFGVEQGIANVMRSRRLG